MTKQNYIKTINSELENLRQKQYPKLMSLEKSTLKTIYELLIVFTELSHKFNTLPRQKGSEIYKIGKKLGHLQTLYRQLTGINLYKPPRKIL